MQTQIARNRFLTHSVMRSLTDGGAMFSTDEKCLKEPWSIVDIQGDLRKQYVQYHTTCIVRRYIIIRIKGVFAPTIFG